MDQLFKRYSDIIPDFRAFQESLSAPLPQHLRVNTLKIEVQQLLDALENKGIHLTNASQSEAPIFLAPEGSSAGKWLEYALGYIHPQALTSCLASIFLAPEPGAYVLDLCAAPGGKTSHLAQLMEGRGLVVANELRRSRHVPLSHTLGRLGVMNAVLTSYPAQEFPLKQRFDFVMADVPCSGEGTIRTTHKHHGAWKKLAKSNLLQTQKRMILRGFDLLRESGEMLYATCTYDPCENESVVDFLLRNRDARLLSIDSPLPFSSGLSGWSKETYDRTMQRAARFYPHVIDSVGFFMARIGRRG